MLAAFGKLSVFLKNDWREFRNSNYIKIPIRAAASNYAHDDDEWLVRDY